MVIKVNQIISIVNIGFVLDGRCFDLFVLIKYLFVQITGVYKGFNAKFAMA